MLENVLLEKKGIPERAVQLFEEGSVVKAVGSVDE
jgi:hypothetical protein